MYAFVFADHETYGVEPICRMLQIAPSGYYAHCARQSDPTCRSSRARREVTLRDEIWRVWRDHHEVDGVRRVWQQLRREGKDVARCTVVWLLRELGLHGVVRGNRVRTTCPAEDPATAPQGLVQRQSTAERPT